MQSLGNDLKRVTIMLIDHQGIRLICRHKTNVTARFLLVPLDSFFKTSHSLQTQKGSVVASRPLLPRRELELMSFIVVDMALV
jgi:hypothetical protein